MYKDQMAREIDLACTVGIHREIVKIFTSRIPEKVTRISATRKQYTLSGNSIVLDILDKLYTLKGTFSDISAEKKAALLNFQELPENIELSFERFAVTEYLAMYFPREVDVNELSEEEISVLYHWIDF